MTASRFIESGISLAIRTESRMFLPVMKADWEGLTTHYITSFSLVARILAIILYNPFNKLIGL